jgi:hypothetical protein
MTSGIQRPSGPSGPGGPEGPDGPDEPEVAGPATAQLDGRIAQLADAVQSGAMQPNEALAELIDGAISPDMDPELATELREVMRELMDHDPYLAGLARDVGVVPPEPGVTDE